MVTRKEIAFCDCKGYLGLIENATAQANQQEEKTSSSVADATNLGDDYGDAKFSISQIKKATGFTINEEDGRDVFTGIRVPSSMGNVRFIP